MKAGDFCRQAAEIVGGDRADAYGDILENHESIAAGWTAYLADKLRPGERITAEDEINLMEIMKVHRRKRGPYHPDNYTDGAGYAGCAGEVAARTRGKGE